MFNEFGEDVYTSISSRGREVRELLIVEDEKGDKKFKYGFNGEKTRKAFENKNLAG